MGRESEDGNDSNKYWISSADALRTYQHAFGDYLDFTVLAAPRQGESLEVQPTDDMQRIVDLSHKIDGLRCRRDLDFEKSVYHDLRSHHPLVMYVRNCIREA